ncbi:MAG: hypothetical protein JXA71_17000 [Chitinispirillaceae bacterium]|nr:hypothetical protein [Chitinispirillaceae bacterium]
MTKKTVPFFVMMLLFIFSTGYGQETGLKGRVVDKDNKPIQGAQVRLITVKKSQTTDWEGKFFFEMKTSTRFLPAGPAVTAISFRNGTLSFDVPGNQRKVYVEVFDKKGQRVSKVTKEGAGEGAYQITILPDNVPVMMYIVKVQIGRTSGIYKFINLGNRTGALPGKEVRQEGVLPERSAAMSKVIDTLEVKKDGYQTAYITILSYTTNLPDIVLKSNAASEEGLPPVVNGRMASTTRYWDCCKPHCGWHSNMRICDINDNDLNDRNAASGCEGGPAFQCWDYAPIEINSKVSYGWAAFNNQGTQCGDCFQLDFQGALEGKQMIVQIINIGNGGTDAFDLLIPGGGVGALNGCSRQWGNAPLGQQYGGFHSTCGNNADCIRKMCQQAFGNKEDLMRGCEWYLTWFKMTSNPKAMYMKVSCPQKIKDISRIGN